MKDINFNIFIITSDTILGAVGIYYIKYNKKRGTIECKSKITNEVYEIFHRDNMYVTVNGTLIKDEIDTEELFNIIKTEVRNNLKSITINETDDFSIEVEIETDKGSEL